MIPELTAGGAIPAGAGPVKYAHCSVPGRLAWLAIAAQP
jgi:hypothetical protein